MTRPQALHIQPAFDSHIWRNSPLFRKAKKIKPFEVDFLAAILQRLDIKKEFDEEAHDKREAIGYTWGMLALFALESDTVFMKHLTLGAFNHLVREFPLRIRTPMFTTAGRYLPKDLGARGKPLRWMLGSLSICWVYSAYLVYALSNEALLSKLIISKELRLQVRTLKDNLPLVRRSLLMASAEVAAFIEKNAHRHTPGDLLLADALICFLLKNGSGVPWKYIAPLIRLSPISRICRVKAMLNLAGSRYALRSELRPKGVPIASPELLIIAGSDQLPGIHHRMSQHLADSCNHLGMDILDDEQTTAFEEAAYIMRWLAYDIYERVVRPDVVLTDSDYWVGVLLLRTYQLAHRDGSLRYALSLSHGDYGSALIGGAPFLRILFQKAIEQPTDLLSSGWRTLLQPENRRSFEELEETYYGI